MRLESLHLSDWKSFGAGDDARNTIQFGTLTLLVGPNASGKSNVLDALRFLQGVALDLPLGDVLRGRWEGQREVWPGVRGHVAEAARHGSTEFFVEATWEGPLHHVLRVATAPEVAVDVEALRDAGGYLFDTHAPALRGNVGRQPGGSINVALRVTGKGNSVSATYSSHRSLLGQLHAQPRVHPGVLDAAASIRGALREAVFLDIRPSAMRDYRPVGGVQLGLSGENVSPVLFGLRERTDPVLGDIVDWLSELCGPAVEAIDFDKTALGEVMFFLVEKGGRRVSARSVSDGTLRFLGLVVAVLTCPEDTLMVLEEPDVGLHPSRIRLLAELLQDVAARRRVQILATTHSPTLLAHLSRDTLGDVVAFAREPDEGTTVCSRLRDLSNFESLASSERLERLVSTGWLERAL
jgi:hypothetical protein